MCKAGRTQPVMGWSERALGTASAAIVRGTRRQTGINMHGLRKTTLCTLEIEPAILPGIEAVVGHGRVDRPRRVAFARNPDLFSGCVLGQGDRQPLGWCKLHDRPVGRRPIDIEYVERGDVRRKSVS